MASYKVTVGADGAATATPANLLDLVTTLVSTESSLTGVMGLAQKGALLAGGMMLQNYRLGRGLNFLPGR